MREMIRKLFIEPIMIPTLEGAPDSDSEASQIIANLAEAVMIPIPMNPLAVIGPAIADAAKILDEITVATPATARVLMAYVSGAFLLTLPDISTQIKH
jgi:hypothetical protein